jgi:hypothetical protein
MHFSFRVSVHIYISQVYFEYNWMPECHWHGLYASFACVLVPKCVLCVRSFVRPHTSSLPGVIATAINLGYGHTCVILTGGGLKCWGLNVYGQLGIGNTFEMHIPVDVSLGAGALIEACADIARL